MLKQRYHYAILFVMLLLWPICVIGNSQPMKSGDVREFNLSFKKSPHCELLNENMHQQLLINAGYLVSNMNVPTEFVVRKYHRVDSPDCSTAGEECWIFIAYVKAILDIDGIEQEKTIDVATSKARLGQLYKVDTKIGARRCGIAKILTVLNLIDKDVGKNGGLNVKSNSDFKKNPDIMLISKRCKTIVDVYNMAEPAAGGLAYIKAAVAAGFHKMITFRTVDCEGNAISEGHAFSLSTALTAYDDALKKDDEKAKDFNNQFGRSWYFCRCRRVRCM